jgi:hypothetical protein
MIEMKHPHFFRKISNLLPTQPGVAKTPKRRPDCGQNLEFGSNNNLEAQKTNIAMNCENRRFRAAKNRIKHSVMT